MRVDRRRLFAWGAALTAILTLTGLSQPAPAENPTTVIIEAAGVGELWPGLCFPQTVSICSPVYEPVQARLVDTSCSVTGVFEGRPIESAACHYELYGFLVPLPAASKPYCAASFFQTSADTTHWGSGRVGTMTIDGITRVVTLASFNIGGTLTMQGTFDDADEGDDPAGDYDMAGAGYARAVQPGSGIGCYSTPTRSVETSAVVAVG